MTPAISEQVRWTIADLEGFPENGNRYEIIDGELFVTRAPHLNHQDVAGLLYAELLRWSIQSRLGKPYMAPGIIFSESDAVIPDLIWISHERRSQLLDASGHLTGAPELIVEVLSITEKDKKRDRETKLKLYSVQGVSEYWIADREQQAIEVYRRENGVLKKAMTLFKTDRLTSPLLPGFSCEVESLFGGNNKLSNQ
ncbi:Uma2 family endonuclease [Microcoleus sp. FACHB-SPT15]|uniref:Uma2 family endonuclease n=1 Tax=Microcoleus sp. FACHB-SPT15 TaxID=2692830 RepID=UPI00178754D1|nr:Uma2 family endonuclease [Microcoleus sp. FACHB-SPT15]MBD1805614.1 Uma2 family endonuclease [Microcoleus sp. FACHB-SPT15]